MKNTINKRFAYAILSLLLILGVALSFTACSNNNNNEEDDYTPPNQISVLQIFEINKTYILADLTNIANEKIEGIPSVLYGDNVVTLYEKQNENYVFTYIVKSRDSIFSYVVKIPPEVVSSTTDNTAISTIISKAGYTADQKINKTNSDIAQVVEKLQAVIAGIRAEIEKLDSKENINVVMHNDYLKFEQENGNIFTGAVREDGSILKFEVTSAGDIFETLVKKDGISLTRSISTTEKYEEPAVEAIQKISVEKILNQYFGDFKAYDFESKAQEIAATSNRKYELLFYSINENAIQLYFNEYSEIAKTNSICQYIYQGSLSKDLMELNKYKDLNDVKLVLGLNSELKVEEGSQEHLELVNKIESFKQQFEASKQKTDSLVNSDFEYKRLLRHTDVQLPKKANEFGEKFAPEGSEVLMTYVGDLTGRNIDSDNSLGSGYYSRFDVLVVYSDGNNHYIKKVSVDVPWYANSTTESLYKHIFESKNYEIAKEKNTTIKNAIVVEPGKQNVQAYEAFEAVNLNLFAKEVEFAR